MGDERVGKPSLTVAFSINDLPVEEKEEEKLSRLQELIIHMKANERNGNK